MLTERLPMKALTRPALRPIAACAVISLVSAPAIASEDNLVLVPDPPLLLALLLLFVLLIVPVNLLVFKPIFKVLDEREARIAGTRARAQKLEEDADAVLGRYEAAVRDVREEAELGRRARLEEARSELVAATGAARRDAEGEIERARSELRSVVGSAQTALRSQAEELARQAASQVLGRSL
jgi:F-type H+-transporting ATPase subunit b